MLENLRAALALGDPQKVAALIHAGADIHYQAKQGYDALLDAVHGRDVLHDPHLMELLTLLLESGVSRVGMSAYGESAVRVLSRIGRFDAVQLLLQAGANPADLELTELIEAVAFGPLAEVEERLRHEVDLEARDYWERTAWLVAVQTGEIPKAQLLLAQGSDTEARGICGKPPLFYAVENGHPLMLKWLLQIGADPRQTDDLGETLLATAAAYGNAEAVEILLEAGVEVDEKLDTGTALGQASTREVVRRLLAAGADPQELSFEGRRALLGYPLTPDTNLLQVSREDFRRFPSPRFGTQNPELMNNPFWEGMIRSGLTAYQGAKRIDDGAYHHPIWCAQRFGQSLTFLEDGRIVQIGGEHEDFYDEDFCIYNDVFVHDPQGNLTLYGYPETVFPPTDFHTTTLLGGYLYVIGSLGYQGTRQYGETPVYRLDINTFQMERLKTTGTMPGWIFKHRAVLKPPHQIQVTGGLIVTNHGKKESHRENTTTFVLDVESQLWNGMSSEWM